MVKIVKFGGSSLADAHQFKKVGDIIKSDPDRRFVVPSAPGKRFKDDIKVTDLLYKAYNAESEQEFECTFDTIKDRYQSIIDELNLTVDLTEEFEVIKKNFQNQISEEYAASRGEYLNGILLANYLGFEFVDPATCIFIDEHGNYDDKKTDPVLSKKLSEVENCVIVPYFDDEKSGSMPKVYIKLADEFSDIDKESYIKNTVESLFISNNGHDNYQANFRDIPRQWVFVDNIPKNTMGKNDYHNIKVNGIDGDGYKVNVNENNMNVSGIEVSKMTKDKTLNKVIK